MAKLVGDETIRDIADRLSQPESYVRGVFGNMAAYRKEVGAEPIVKIGCTGEGFYPHYRIEPESRPDPHAIIDFDMDGFLKLATFNGRNHSAMDWTAKDIVGEHWSSGSMTYRDVQNLLGDIRGFARRARD